MTWHKASEKRIGNYIWWDAEVESPALLPLLECLSYAIEVNRPLDFFIRGILTDEGPSGGDPGWVLYQDRLENGRMVYHAWTNPDMSDLDPNEGDYDEAVVKLHIRRTLDNFAMAHPERRAEVEKVITQYEL